MNAILRRRLPPPALRAARRSARPALPRRCPSAAAAATNRHRCRARSAARRACSRSTTACSSPWQQLNAQRSGGAGAPHDQGRARRERSDPHRRHLSRRSAVVGVVGHPESGTTLDAIGEYADDEERRPQCRRRHLAHRHERRADGREQVAVPRVPQRRADQPHVARYVLDSLHATRASVIYRNDAYGKDWSKSFGDAFRAGKGTSSSAIRTSRASRRGTPMPATSRSSSRTSSSFRAAPKMRCSRCARCVRWASPRRSWAVTRPSGLEANADEFPYVRYAAFFLARRATTPEAKAFIAAYDGRIQGGA